MESSRSWNPLELGCDEQPSMTSVWVILELRYPHRSVLHPPDEVLCESSRHLVHQLKTSRRYYDPSADRTSLENSGYSLPEHYPHLGLQNQTRRSDGVSHRPRQLDRRELESRGQDQPRARDHTRDQTGFSPPRQLQVRFEQRLPKQHRQCNEDEVPVPFPCIERFQRVLVEPSPEQQNSTPLACKGDRAKQLAVWRCDGHATHPSVLRRCDDVQSSWKTGRGQTLWRVSQPSHDADRPWVAPGEENREAVYRSPVQHHASSAVAQSPHLVGHSTNWWR
mmetsp:Transcript_17418/g.44346  ORF Transcript_17418/g.44346 Transcript_17418/m.44346 type:complete len:279 (+) Transcript_17418:1163-1999(+)